MAHHAPRVVGQIHAHQHITGHTHAADGLFHRVLVLNNGLHGNLNLEHLILGLQVLDAGLNPGLHLILVPRVGVHHIPVTDLAAQLRFELLQRVGSGSSLCGALRLLRFRLLLSGVRSGLLISCDAAGSLYFVFKSFGLSGFHLDLFNLGYHILLGHVAPTFSVRYLCPAPGGGAN